MQSSRRRNFIRKDWSVFNGTRFQYDASIEYHNHPLIVIGSMNKKCQYCDAFKWNDETAGMCCSNGKVSLPLFGEPEEPLKTLLLSVTNESKQFLSKIGKYNSCFQMTSFGVDKVIRMPGFSPTFTLQGQIHHQIGSLFPEGNDQHKFLQVYFMGDEQNEVNRRCQYIEGVERETVLKIRQMLPSHNVLLKIFKSAIDNWPSDNYKVVIHADQTPRCEHERRYNAPMVNEVAVLVTGEPCSPRDIVLRAHDNTLKRIANTHKFYDALQYPLIFRKGEPGYHFNIPLVNPITEKPIPNKKVSLESERLRYIALNQKKLRAENYIPLQDAISADDNIRPNDIGKVVILPSTFVNSPRYLQEYTQDAFTYVQTYGRPDLFVTFTCNPSWQDVTQELMSGQKATDQHDIVAHVFRLKVQKLMNVVTKGKVFGDIQCHMYSIEWQKRGLPHVHILIWLKQKLLPNQIDNIISAEIPDPEEDKNCTSVENQPGIKASDALGLVYTVHVTNLECFCLRMLLHHVRGPTSFTELKIVNGQECQTYREACEARRLLENDNHWDETLEKAVQCRSPDKIRELYATLLFSCGLSNPQTLWDKYKEYMAEDILYTLII
ncbi:ATP-dependent DNA helicase [Trichonephila clavipes]|uniref:ATP-dependent DNA helicase n=1 Tax=Trichonephila clavipes TaxID=2585209 RepID=A0A8X6VDC7_TRICX|nr:ATP-dependent DNA helicase [Trichonephila clavipes]